MQCAMTSLERAPARIDMRLRQQCDSIALDPSRLKSLRMTSR
jgi:hypothetical protein